jgi:hypothetical protein
MYATLTQHSAASCLASLTFPQHNLNIFTSYSGAVQSYFAHNVSVLSTYSWRLSLLCIQNDHEGTTPPIKDLASSPWSKRPVLVDSAWKRVKIGKWKWAQICRRPPVRGDRKKAGLPAVAWTEEDEKAQAEYKKQFQKKGAKKRQRNEEKEEEDEYEEVDSEGE